MCPSKVTRARGRMDAESEATSAAKRSLLRRWPLSETDRAIIGHLQEDGRRPFVTIAKDLGLSEKTVRTRVHHLLEANIIQIVALTSPAALGYHTAALAGITTDPGVPTSNIALALREIDDVDYVIMTTGRYSLFAEIISYDMSKMQAVVEREIGRIRGIKSLEIFPYFSVYYQKARFFGPSSHDSLGRAVKEEELDPIDKKIVMELNQNGRAPLKSIAEKLDVSESQVRMHIANMIEAGKMNVTAIINPMNLAEQAIAYVGIEAKHNSSLHALAEELSQIPQISYITICAGRYDLFAEVVCRSNHELLQVIDLGIRQLPGAAKVETFVYIDVHYKRLVPVRGWQPKEIP